MELYKNHRENALKAQKLAVQSAIKKKQFIREEYDKKPNKCAHCGDNLNFYKRKNKFCSSSCSASFNNQIRGPHSEEVKEKISISLRKNPSSPKKRAIVQVRNNKKKYALNPKKCKVCGSELSYEFRGRKTCSDECNIIASVRIRPYQNGSRKNIWYFNKNENKKVLLESSWELKIAQFLDEKKINWVRPEHIVWYDKKNKKRYYFPDFYLVDYNLYIDPKNPYCLQKGKEKMMIISEKCNIIYGDITEIIDRLNSIFKII